MIPGVDPVNDDRVIHWDSRGWDAPLHVWSGPDWVILAAPLDKPCGGDTHLAWSVPPDAARALAWAIRAGTACAADLSTEHTGSTTVDLDFCDDCAGLTLTLSVDQALVCVTFDRNPALCLADALDDAARWSELADLPLVPEWSQIADALAYANNASRSLGLTPGYLYIALTAVLTPVTEPIDA